MMEVIKLTESQTMKMFKMKDILSDMFDNGNLHGLTPYEVKEACSCYNQIVKSIEHYGMTIFDNVANFFKKCGFRVEKVDKLGTIPHYHIHILTQKQEQQLEID